MCIYLLSTTIYVVLSLGEFEIYLEFKYCRFKYKYMPRVLFEELPACPEQLI